MIYRADHLTGGFRSFITAGYLKSANAPRARTGGQFGFSRASRKELSTADHTADGEDFLSQVVGEDSGKNRLHGQHKAVRVALVNFCICGLDQKSQGSSRYGGDQPGRPDGTVHCCRPRFPDNAHRSRTRQRRCRFAHGQGGGIQRGREPAYCDNVQGETKGATSAPASRRG